MTERTPDHDASDDVAANVPVFAVRSYQVDGATVVEARGEVDALTAPDLDEAIGRAVVQPGAVIVDLCEVGFLASAGMGVLAAANEKASEPFLVAADGPATSRPIRMVGLDQVLRMYPTLQAAIAACREA